MLLTPESQNFLRGKNLVGVHGIEHVALSCYVGGNIRSGTSVNCIVEGGNRHMSYCIFEVTFGTEWSPPGRAPTSLPYAEDRVSGESDCHRLGEPSFRVCIFHTQNKSNFGPVGEVLNEMLKNVVLHKAFIVAGDGNKHAKYNSNKHNKECDQKGIMELHKALIPVMARAFFSKYNEDQPFASRVEVPAL